MYVPCVHHHRALEYTNPPPSEVSTLRGLIREQGILHRYTYMNTPVQILQIYFAHFRGSKLSRLRLLSSCIAIRVLKRLHRSFQPDTKCSLRNPTSFYSYNSSVSILGIIFFSILNDDSGMLHSELNCSSSFSRTAKASAKAFIHW